MPPVSLLQDVLKQQLEAVEDAQRRTALLSPPDSDDDETIDVVRLFYLFYPEIALFTHSITPSDLWCSNATRSESYTNPLNISRPQSTQKTIKTQFTGTLSNPYGCER
jgi:hypothetical protein